MASSSRAADRLIVTLYLSTLLQIPDEVLEPESRFLGSLLEGRQVLGVFGERTTDGVIHEIREGAIRFGRLVLERTVEVGSRARRYPLFRG